MTRRNPLISVIGKNKCMFYQVSKSGKWLKVWTTDQMLYLYGTLEPGQIKNPSKKNSVRDTAAKFLSPTIDIGAIEVAKWIARTDIPKDWKAHADTIQTASRNGLPQKTQSSISQRAWPLKCLLCSKTLQFSISQ